MWGPPFSAAILVFGCTWKRGKTASAAVFKSQGLQCCTQTSRQRRPGAKDEIKKHMAYSRNHGMRFDSELLFIIEEGIKCIYDHIYRAFTI